VSDRILTASDVEAIVEATARKVVEIVDARSTTLGLVDAHELAEELGVSIDYLYAHATERDAMKLGSGPKARIRFRSRSGRQARAACDDETATGKAREAASPNDPDRHISGHGASHPLLLPVQASGALDRRVLARRISARLRRAL
jgi:hypothetical protein